MVRKSKTNGINQVVQVKFFGSSHFTERHFFPQLMSPYLPIDLIPKFEGKSGAIMSKAVKTKIVNSIKNDKRPSLVVVCLGGNNLRRKRADIDAIVSLFKCVVEEAERHPWCKILLCGLIPDLNSDDEDRAKRFMQLNDKLKSLASEHQKVAQFMKMSNTFVNASTGKSPDNKLDRRPKVPGFIA